MAYKSTYSITFGNQGENHVGMQKVGQDTAHGLSIQEINSLDIPGKKIYRLNDYLPDGVKAEEALLVVFKCSDLMKKSDFADKLLAEFSDYDMDKQAFMYGRVCNKKARWNDCWSDFSQDSDFQNKKGTVRDFKDSKLMSRLRRKIGKLNPKCQDLIAETNQYYDQNECGIGYHGDKERKIVVCLRLGNTMSLCYQWFKDGVPIGDRLRLDLEHGDMYIMSEKAVGFDCAKRKIATLRHAAGADKYIVYKKSTRGKKKKPEPVPESDSDSDSDSD